MDPREIIGGGEEKDVTGLMILHYPANFCNYEH